VNADFKYGYENHRDAAFEGIRKTLCTTINEMVAESFLGG